MTVACTNLKRSSFVLEYHALLKYINDYTGTGGGHQYHAERTCLRNDFETSSTGSAVSSSASSASG